MADSSNLKRVKTYKDLNGRGRDTAYRVLEAVARSQSLMVYCGSGVSVAAGIPTFSDLRSMDVVPGTSIDCQRFFDVGQKDSNKLSTSDLMTFGPVMTQFRVAARQAPVPPFHRFLQRKLKSGQCTDVATENFDGLETRGLPEFKTRVSALHGTNTSLWCPVGSCLLEGDEVANFDSAMLAGELVRCPNCKHKDSRRFRPNTPSPILRPDVALGGQYLPEVHHEDGAWSRLVDHAAGVDTLLIAGASLESEEASSLVEHLKAHVSGNDGAVVFINTTDYSRQRHAHIMDFNLVLDIQQCSELMLDILDQVI
ncbi:hypothetical protein FRC07_003282 [Ceratobasidium sp. 392]|nr:hypothetical protein FRC07_003282 [Ceratobasidium sp. 392]